MLHIIGILRYVLVAAVIGSMLAAAGCASMRPSGSSEAASIAPRSTSQGTGWWTARFLIDWPQDKEPAWHRDVLLAHRVVAPVLSRYGSEILLWRFHRRAARDPSGHQFSFLFYASPETARRVFQSLRSDQTLGTLKAAGFVVNDAYDDTSQITKPNLEDTSDRNWSPEVQRSWPYFIMGVSEMWLHLIDETAQRTAPRIETSSPEALDAFYKQVSASVKASWQEEGGHALLHHLNAIFGYEPVIVQEKRLQRF